MPNSIFSSKSKRITTAFAILFGFGIQFFSFSTYAEPDWLLAEQPLLTAAITPTRIKKSALEQPVAVSVIDRHFIQSSGANSIAELMAFVPGMARAYRPNREQSIAYHGLHSINPKRMQVLIDGMSFYDAGLSQVDWRHIPITPDQIERIEVTRSPSAAVYGSNSFNGIINIISRKLPEQAQVNVKLYQNSEQTKQINVSGKLGKTDNAISVHYQHQTHQGFDDFKDSSRQHRIKVQHQIQNHNWQSFTQASYIKDDFDGDIPPEVDISSSKSEDWYLQNQTLWQLEQNFELQLTQYLYQKKTQSDWQACFHPSFLSTEFAELHQHEPALMSALLAGEVNIQQIDNLSELAQAAVFNYLSYGGPQAQSICGQANNYSEQMRKQIELQATWVINPNLKMVTGGYWRQDRIDSNVYLQHAGWQTFNSFVTFANIEYRAHPDMLIDLALMNEKHQQGADSLSPRIALNYQVCEHCSVRFNYSYTERIPGEFEQNGQFEYFIHQVEPNPYQITQGTYFLSSSAKNQLISEKMKAVEMGFHYYNWQTGLDIDLNLFHQSMTDLINQSVSLEDFNFVNDLNAALNGVELEVNWQFNLRNQVKLSSSVLNWQLRKANSANDHIFSPDMSLAIFHTYQPQNWQIGWGGMYQNVEEAGELTQLQMYLQRPLTWFKQDVTLGVNSFYRVDTSRRSYRLSEFNNNWMLALSLELTW